MSGRPRYRRPLGSDIHHSVSVANPSISIRRKGVAGAIAITITVIGAVIAAEREPAVKAAPKVSAEATADKTSAASKTSSGHSAKTSYGGAAEMSFAAAAEMSCATAAEMSAATAAVRECNGAGRDDRSADDK